MKKSVFAVIAFLLIVPSVATAGAMAQRAAARTLTNQVMRMLEPKIDEIVDNSAVAPDLRDELKRQLSESADRLVNQQIQSMIGGSLPNPATIVNSVVAELATIAQNMAAGGSGGGSGSAVLMSSAGRSDGAHNVQVVAQPVAAPRAKPNVRIEPFVLWGYNDSDMEAIINILSMQDSLRMAYNIVSDEAEYVLVTDIQRVGNMNVMMMRILNVIDSSQLAGGNISFRAIEEVVEQIPQIAGRLSAPMLARAEVVQAQTPTPVYIVNTPPTPAHVPTVRERQINTDAVDHFFTLKWYPTIEQKGHPERGVNAEYGQIRGNGWWWSIDLGGGNLGTVSNDIQIINYSTFNIGRVWEFANRMHFAYGMAASFTERWESHECINNMGFTFSCDSQTEYGFVGPIVKWRWQLLEVTYRGLIGGTYINQAMIGFYFGTNRRRQ